jgi:hypothetical protein
MVADPFNVITKLYSWAGLGTIIPQPVKKHILEVNQSTTDQHHLLHCICVVSVSLLCIHSHTQVVIVVALTFVTAPHTVY